ncbi:MAG TPA: Wzt carbohydrate-binding domain-containing protein, partial [Burkholderiales bacterium]|nr:Wzt carbohydrate-binding domain-containing protein [Burkholderiales bacterium]
AGFNPEFTGRENVYLNAAILGLSNKEIEAKYDDIAAFADIGGFIDQPVKTYSSGMFVRLAFAVAINVEPDILVVDEALSVGDIHFQQRCFQKIRAIREAGTSIVFVSHDIEMVKRICDRAMVLHDGAVVYAGHPAAATAYYIALVAADFDLARVNFNEPGQQPGPREDSTLSPGGLPSSVYRHGDGTASVRSVRAGATPNDPALVGVGERVRFDIEVEFHQAKAVYIVGMLIKDRTGAEIIGLNTYQEKFDVPAVQAGDVLVFSFTMPIDLRPGDYSVSATIAYSQYEMKWMDWVDNALVLRVTDRVGDRRIFGLVLPPNREVAVRRGEVVHTGAGAGT